jgi:ATP-dependent RNA helicase RhlE
MSFDTFGLHPSLLRGLAELGFTEATPIQASAVPPAIAGRDVLACAMTGSGKTAAFALPILNRLHGGPSGATRALVLTPTRELAAQVAEHVAALARHTTVRGAAVTGGAPMRPQEEAFRRGVGVIVATPGRLLDHLRFPYARLDRIEVLVLDEADRMLDMGFLPDIRRVLRHLPRRRQTLFFSATMPRPIVELSRDILSDPITIDVGLQSAPATGVRQLVFRVEAAQKNAILLELLREYPMESVIAFTRTKHRADRLHAFLHRSGIRSACIHGNRSQSQRTAALDGFKRGSFRVLVATDIAARGIDVEAVSHVVNYDVPRQPEDYVHRVGRTARMHATGDAYTLASPEEHRELKAIERALGQLLPRGAVAGFAEPAPPPSVPVSFLRRIKRGASTSRARAARARAFRARR